MITTCIFFVRLPISVGALYVQKYFSENSCNVVLDIVNDIRDEFMDILENIDWMDDKTKSFAKRKAKAIVNHIGYPNELLNVSKIEEYYKNLEIADDNFLLNKLKLRIFITDYSHGKLREPVNKTDWETHSIPAVVNAGYTWLENGISKCQYQ